MTEDERDSSARKRRRVRLVQRYLINPLAKAGTWAGLLPGYALVETTGRRSGQRRITVVGMQRDGDIGWVVAEHGRHAGYVANLLTEPRVRVRVGHRWRSATAHLVDEDDVEKRLGSFSRSHAATVRRMGTELTTVRFDFDVQ